MEIGDIVVANSMGLGLPYRAKIEAINGDRAKIRPFHATLTEGSARRHKTRQGDSIRARWVKLSYLQAA